MTTKIGKDFKIKESACGHCGKLMDGASNWNGDEAPSEGDCMVCFYCLGVCVYKNDLTLRAATDKEIAEWDHDLRMTINEIRRKIDQFWRIKGDGTYPIKSGDRQQ